MIRCPYCRADIPNHSSSCLACGNSLVPGTEPLTDEFTIGDYSTVAASPGLPEPMTEPISAISPAISDTERTGRTSMLSKAVPDSDPKPPTPPPPKRSSTIRDVQTAVAPKAGVPSLKLPSQAIAPPAPRTATAPKLRVIRGEKVGVVFELLDGRNFIGRFVDKPVDIDLNGQEAPDQVWASRQHAVLTVDKSGLLVEDLNSLNGTFVNRVRVHPGQGRRVSAGDVIQIGTVQMRVEF